MMLCLNVFMMITNYDVNGDEDDTDSFSVARKKCSYDDGESCCQW